MFASGIRLPRFDLVRPMQTGQRKLGMLSQNLPRAFSGSPRLWPDPIQIQCSYSFVTTKMYIHQTIFCQICGLDSRKGNKFGPAGTIEQKLTVVKSAAIRCPVKRKRALLGSNPPRDSRMWVALNNAPEASSLCCLPLSSKKSLELLIELSITELPLLLVPHMAEPFWGRA